MHYVIEEENNATLRTPVLLSRGAKKFYGHTGLCSGVRIGNSPHPGAEDFGFRPNTSLREGLRRFAKWYANYYGKI